MFNLFSKKSAKEEQEEKDSKFEIQDDDDEEEEDSAFLKSLKLNLSRLIGYKTQFFSYCYCIIYRLSFFVKNLYYFAASYINNQ